MSSFQFKRRAQRLIPKGVFFRRVSVLLGGTASAQILNALAAPLLTRLYTPEDFGLLAVFTALMALFTVIAAARYEQAIPLPESNQSAANIALFALFVVFIVTVIALFIFLAWPQEIAGAMNAPELAKYLWLIPLGVLFVGCYQIFNKWAVRCKQFSGIARTRVYQSVGALAIQLGAFKFGAVALLGGHTVGQGVGVSGLAIPALRRSEFSDCSLRDMWRQAKRYRDFPIYSTWSGLFNVASLQLAPVVFLTLFGSSVAGLYALSLRILTMPVNLIGNAVGSVFLSEAPQANLNNTLSELVAQLHSRLFVMGAMPLAVLLFFGPELFALIFGEQWRKAGVYAQWMAPWIYLQFQWSPLSMLVAVLELQSEALVLQVITFSMRFGVLLIAWYMGFSVDSSVLMFSIASASAYSLRMGWFFSRAGCNVLIMLKKELLFVFGSLVTVGLFYLLISVLISN